MRILKQCTILIFLIHSLAIFAQGATYRGNPDTSFLTARDLAFSGNRSQAKDTLALILTKYPDYTDVRNLLAKIHSWDGDYDIARRQFNKITSSEKTNKEVWIAAIKNELYATNYATALGLGNKALLYVGADKDLEQLRGQALQNINENEGNRMGSVEIIAPKDSLEADPNSAKNRIGIYNAIDVFDVVYDPMVASSIEYKKDTKLGSVLPRINYANRFQTNGLQYEIDFYPRVSKTFYAYLNYGYSASAIYPDHRVGGELYANLPKALETSLGFRYLKFNNIDAKIITGSAGLYKGNYYFSFRPFVTLPEGANPIGFSGSLLARKYLRDKDNYLGINAVVGYAPELRQLRTNSVLLAETLLHIESEQLNLEYQFSSGRGYNIYRANLGVTRQELVFDPGNFFWAVSAGITYQVKF